MIFPLQTPAELAGVFLFAYRHAPISPTDLPPTDSACIFGAGKIAGTRRGAKNGQNRQKWMEYPKIPYGQEGVFLGLFGGLWARGAIVVYHARFRSVVGRCRGARRGGNDHATGREGGTQKVIFGNKTAKEKRGKCPAQGYF
jgi:hypothetical protein